MGVSLINAAFSLMSILGGKTAIPVGFAIFLLLVPVLVNVFLALGALRLKWWARVLLLVLALISLITTTLTFVQSFKTVTAFVLLSVNLAGSGFILWALMRREVIELFNQNKDTDIDVFGLSHRVRTWLLRLVVLNSFVFVLSTMVLRVKNALGLSQEMRSVLVVYMFITLAMFLYFLIYSFVHWSRQSFRKKSTKYLWLTCLVLGLLWHFIGHFVYYIVVMEMKKSLQQPGEKTALPSAGGSASENA